MDRNGREDGVETGLDEDPNSKHEKKEEEMMSIERVFENQEVPSWRRQLTARAFVVSFMLSVLFSFIVMKLNLTTGIIPSLNISAGLLGFFFVKTWTKMLEKSGLLRQPFTRQENTVIQTCVVASSGIAFSGGFGSYMFGMSERIANQSGDNSGYKNPALGWMIGFLFIVSFLGLFSVVPLRKVMIVDFKLTYPSGTATAYLINSFAFILMLIGLIILPIIGLPQVTVFSLVILLSLGRVRNKLFHLALILKVSIKFFVIPHQNFCHYGGFLKI